MLKFAFIITNLCVGGAEQAILRLGHALSQAGHRVDIILLENKILIKNTYGLNIHSLSHYHKITPLAPLNRYLLSLRLKKLIKKLEKEKPFNLICSNLLLSDRVCTKISHPNLVFCLHNATSMEISKSKQQAKSLLKRQKTYKDKHMIAVSHGVASDFIKHILKPKSICVIYNPFDINSIQSLANKHIQGIPKEDYLIYVGRNKPQKRLDLLLNAFAKINSPIKLVMLTPADKELTEMIHQLNLQQKVLLIGFQQNPYPWIKKAKSLILSSDYEGFGNVIVESLICHTPVVATDCPYGPNEILTGELAHWLVPCNSPNDLAHKINELLVAQVTISASDYDRFSVANTVNNYIALAKKLNKPS